MALFKYPLNLQVSIDSGFDEKYAPGHIAPHPGIYRCTSCGDEIAIAGGNVLPPQNHRQHDPESGDIEWQLIVAPQQVH